MEADLIESGLNEFILPDTQLICSQHSSQELSSSHDFMPLSPTKRFGARLADSSIPPESPDMKFARRRLGTLLTSIKHGEAPAVTTTADKKSIGMEEEEQGRRGPGRPRKVRFGSKDKQVVFELRGKPFGLQDGRSDTMYQLCRAWMRGKASDDIMHTGTLVPPPSDASLDLLATREIHALPRAKSPYPVEALWPDRKSIDVFDINVDPENIEILRKEYARHWKEVKNSWRSHMRYRSQRYHRSIKLLETVYSIAQHNAV